MQLQLQNFTALVQTMAAGVQSSANALIDLTTGSVLRALLEANASAALWLQWLIVQVLAATRAATSAGPDLDSWVADFGVTRLPGQSATTSIVFSRFTPGLGAAIPAGAQVKTADAGQIFAVTIDPANPAYNPATTSYALPATASSLTVPAQAVLPGAAGNVQAGSVALIATAIPGIDTVTNPAAAAGGADPEADDALRARFTNFIDSRSRATPAAIAYAIQSLQQGLVHVLAENMDPSGAIRAGFFTVTVDDGSGTPQAATLQAVAAAVEAVRPIGSQFAVQAPSVVAANIAFTVTAPAAGLLAAQNAASAAVTAYAAALPIGRSLPLARIAALALAADDSITNISAVSINGGGDLVPPPTGVIKPGTMTVS